MPTVKDYTMKYSKVNPLSKLRDGEPFFIVRAQDKLSVDTVRAYADLLQRESNHVIASGNFDLANELMKQAIGVTRVASIFQQWQADHPEFVKLPD